MASAYHALLTLPRQDRDWTVQFHIENDTAMLTSRGRLDGLVCGRRGAQDEDRGPKRSQSLRQLTPFRSPRCAQASDVGSGLSSGSSNGENAMKRPSSRALSAGALFGLLSVTPAFAQVAGNPGDLHTQTLYMQQYHRLNGYTARAPEPAKTTTSCDVIHDFNTSATHFGYIAVCSLFSFH